MKIQVNTVEGLTAKKGLKQNKLYTIVRSTGEITLHRGQVIDTTNFYLAIDEKGREFSVWDINRNWSKIGICKSGMVRMTYTSNFTIIQE